MFYLLELRPYSCPVEPGQEVRCLGITEIERTDAEQVGGQRRPAHQVGRSFDDHSLAGHTIQIEAELPRLETRASVNANRRRG